MLSLVLIYSVFNVSRRLKLWEHQYTLSLIWAWPLSLEYIFGTGCVLLDTFVLDKPNLLNPSVALSYVIRLKNLEYFYCHLDRGLTTQSSKTHWYKKILSQNQKVYISIGNLSRFEIFLQFPEISSQQFLVRLWSFLFFDWWDRQE